MFNVSIKSIPFFAALLLLGSCGKSPERQAAEALLTQADAEIAAGNSEKAMVLLDSIASAFPGETEVRKDALALRPKAVQAATIREIEQTDSLIAALELEYKDVEGKMKKISGKELPEPYFVPAEGYNPDFVSSTGVQARVDLVGQFYLLSSVAGKNLRHVAVEFSNGNESVETKHVSADGETNFRFGGSELITYEPGGCDTIGEFFLNNRNAALKGAFISENGKKTPFRLSPAQVGAIADAYRYSRSIVVAREAAVKRQKLDRQLQIARDQIARTNE